MYQQVQYCGPLDGCPLVVRDVNGEARSFLLFVVVQSPSHNKKSLESSSLSVPLLGWRRYDRRNASKKTGPGRGPTMGSSAGGVARSTKAGCLNPHHVAYCAIESRSTRRGTRAENRILDGAGSGRNSGPSSSSHSHSIALCLLSCVCGCESVCARVPLSWARITPLVVGCFNKLWLILPRCWNGVALGGGQFSRTYLEGWPRLLRARECSGGYPGAQVGEGRRAVGNYLQVHRTEQLEKESWVSQNSELHA